MKTERARPESTSREAKHWAVRYAGAQTPAALAAVEWDRVRATVRDLPEQDQPRAWRELGSLLKSFQQAMGSR